MAKIRFSSNDTTVAADLLERSQAISRFTGKELLQLEVQFTVSARDLKLIEPMRANGEATLISTADEGDRQVQIFQKVQSFNTNSTDQTLTWLLTEKETFQLESLHLNDTVIFPSFYSEEFDGDDLIGKVRFSIDAEEEKIIRSLPLYFDVVRKGINNRPISMRFGRILWQKTDEGFEMHAVLVAESYDSTHPETFVPEVNIKRISVRTSTRLNHLVELLKAKGVLSEAECESLAKIDDDEMATGMNEFSKVRDLDQLLKGENS